MYTIDQSTSTSKIYCFSIFIGIGTGCFVQASFSVAQAKAEPSEVSSVVGFISCSQFIGITIALAIANTVFLNEAERKLAVILPTASALEVKAAIAGVGSAFFDTLSRDVRESVLHAIILSMDKVYILVMTAGLITIALSLLLKR